MSRSDPMGSPSTDSWSRRRDRATRRRIVTEQSVAVVREVGATVRALLWPAAIVGLAILFRGSLAMLLGRASAVSVTTPLGGVSIAARVVGLLASADAARAQAYPRDTTSEARPTMADLLWIDDRPDGGRAERAALAAAGITAEVVSRADDAATRAARLTVLAGPFAADAACVASVPPATTLVLYPEPGASPPMPRGRDIAICRDAASLFVTIASRLA